MAADPRLRRFLAQLQDLARAGSSSQRRVLTAVATQLRTEVRAQLAAGRGPDGSAQPPTKRGKPALVSPRLARAVDVVPTGTAVRVESKGSHVDDILAAHQDGHTWPARRQSIRFSARGKLISAKRFGRLAYGKPTERTAGANGYTGFSSRTKTGKSRLKAYKVRANVGARVLPPRPIYPPGSTLTAPWRDAIAAGVERGMGAEWSQATR